MHCKVNLCMSDPARSGDGGLRYDSEDSSGDVVDLGEVAWHFFIISSAYKRTRVYPLKARIRD